MTNDTRVGVQSRVHEDDLTDRVLENVERREPSKSLMLPRPEGMTRQEHLRLYREAVKMARGDWRTANQRAYEHRRRVLLSIKNFPPLEKKS